MVLAIPPADAGRGLIKLKTGEIRHYGGEVYGQEVSRVNYIYSIDNGIHWKEGFLHPGEISADFQSPKTGAFYRLFSVRNKGLFFAKTEGGINGKTIFSTIDSLGTWLWPRRAIYIPGKNRILFPCNTDQSGSIVYYTDDEGLSWKRTDWITVSDGRIEGDNKSLRWQQLGVEPSLVQLKDGRIWMILRTSHDQFYESFSEDFGETWSSPTPSRFYGTNTMPNIFRMSDGRLLFFWCNSTPLPEFPKPSYMKYFLGDGIIEGKREDVFTNRDVIHVAISDDDGNTWKGFRELYLTTQRNSSNYGLLGEGNDKSVHQSQCIELGEGKILLSCGQNSAFRVLVAFDVAWLYEKERKNDFSSGIDDLCVFQYISGKVGHCSLNRKAGANIIPDPEDNNNKVLKICNPMESSLVIENQGATWNFPSGKKGEVSLDLYLTDEFKGANISLIDRWFNPVDTTAYKNAMFVLDIGADAYLAKKIKLDRNKWYRITVSWDYLDKSEKLSDCSVVINGQKQKIKLPLINNTLNGISYLHLQSRAKEKDSGGFYVDNFYSIVK
ncbi:MAG: glycoside hydrolase [Chitinophagaceae bacterium]|nr:glycoside hydrolase [Chitinophagaceae bacterium]